MQNILAVYNFKMHFCYIFLEWKGFTYDNRVFKDAIDKKGFVIPDRKYWLRDTGYSNSDHLLMPYKKLKYHLKEILLVLKKQKNTKKLFNLRYFSLCNIIEHIFRVAKKQFPCLKIRFEFLKQIQIEIIYTVIAFHNFIQKNYLEEEDIFPEPDLENQSPDSMSINNMQPTFQSISVWIDKKRNAIAEKIQRDY